MVSGPSLRCELAKSCEWVANFQIADAAAVLCDHVSGARTAHSARWAGLPVSYREEHIDDHESRIDADSRAGNPADYAAKAQAGNPLFFDPTAQDVLNRVDYDFTRLHVPYKTVVLVCQRAKKLV